MRRWIIRILVVTLLPVVHVSSSTSALAEYKFVETVVDEIEGLTASSSTYNEVDVDGDGNIIVLGWSNADPTTSEQGGYFSFLRKMSPTGEVMWSKVLPSRGAYSRTLAVAASGTIFVGVSGDFLGDGTANLLAYSSEGELRWESPINYAKSAVDFDINVIFDIAVVGDPLTESEDPVLALQYVNGFDDLGDLSNEDISIARFSGQSGAPLWVEEIPGITRVTMYAKYGLRSAGDSLYFIGSSATSLTSDSDDSGVFSIELDGDDGSHIETIQHASPSSQVFLDSAVSFSGRIFVLWSDGASSVQVGEVSATGVNLFTLGAVIPSGLGISPDEDLFGFGFADYLPAIFSMSESGVQTPLSLSRTDPKDISIHPDGSLVVVGGSRVDLGFGDQLQGEQPVGWESTPTAFVAVGPPNGDLSYFDDVDSSTDAFETVIDVATGDDGGIALLGCVQGSIVDDSGNVVSGVFVRSYSEMGELQWTFPVLTSESCWFERGSIEALPAGGFVVSHFGHVGEIDAEGNPVWLHRFLDPGETVGLEVVGSSQIRVYRLVDESIKILDFFEGTAGVDPQSVDISDLDPSSSFDADSISLTSVEGGGLVVALYSVDPNGNEIADDGKVIVGGFDEAARPLWSHDFPSPWQVTSNRGSYGHFQIEEIGGVGVGVSFGIGVCVPFGDQGECNAEEEFRYVVYDGTGDLIFGHARNDGPGVRLEGVDDAGNQYLLAGHELRMIDRRGREKWSFTLSSGYSEVRADVGSSGQVSLVGIGDFDSDDSNGWDVVIGSLRVSESSGGGGAGGRGGDSPFDIGRPISVLPKQSAPGFFIAEYQFSFGNVSVEIRTDGATPGPVTFTPREGVPPADTRGVRLPGVWLEVTIDGGASHFDLCVPYESIDVRRAGLDEDELRLFHWANGVRVDITTEIERSAQRVCGRTSSASPFAVGALATERLNGTDRFDTSARSSELGYANGADTVYLVSGFSLSDGLAAVASAGFRRGPLLLVSGSSLTDSVQAELQRLSPMNVVLVGGIRAVSTEIESAVRNLLPNAAISRLAGSDRVETMILASSTNHPREASTLVIASEGSASDSLVAASLAHHTQAPLLLVGASLDPRIAREIRRLAPDEILLVGGPAAVSDSVVGAIFAQVPGAFLERFAGSDRYDTAARAVAESPSGGISVVASGTSWVDGVSGLSFAIGSGATFLIVPSSGSVPQIIGSALDRLHPDRLVVVGGGDAISYQNENILASRL